jgi:hypothetical protein
MSGGIHRDVSGERLGLGRLSRRDRRRGRKPLDPGLLLGQGKDVQEGDEPYAI